MVDSGVAREGRVVGIPKFHSWGKYTMPLRISTQIGCPTLPLACMCIILVILYYIILYYIILYYIILYCIILYYIILYYIILYEQSNRTQRCSLEVSAAGLPWLEHFTVQCYS